MPPTPEERDAFELRENIARETARQVLPLALALAGALALAAVWWLGGQQ